MENESMLMMMPPEVRLLIYSYLLDIDTTKDNDAGVAVRHIPRHKAADVDFKDKRRTNYHVLERSFVCASYQTSYSLASPGEVHPAILAVNRKIREEASHFLYASRPFDFGVDMGAVVPFFEDKTPSTRELIEEITIYRRGSSTVSASDPYDWASICRYLGDVPSFKNMKLKLVVEAGQPWSDWEGPKQLSVADLRLLYSTRHEALEWVRELAQLEKIGQVELVTQASPMPAPKNNESLVFAALSASIETSLVDFIRSELGVRATSAANPLEETSGDRLVSCC